MKIIIHYKNGFEIPIECESFQVETGLCDYFEEIPKAKEEGEAE